MVARPSRSVGVSENRDPSREPGSVMPAGPAERSVGAAYSGVYPGG